MQRKVCVGSLRIKLRVYDTSSSSLKPACGNLLEVFEVTTKQSKSSAFLMDSHLQEIINSSFRSLVCIRLQSCRYIRKFYDIGRCTQLRALFITDNSYQTPYLATSPMTTSGPSPAHASASSSSICLAAMASTRASSSISAS